VTKPSDLLTIRLVVVSANSAILAFFPISKKISKSRGSPLNALSFLVNLSWALIWFKREDLDNVMKDLRLCSGCMNYKPKHSMAKTGDCAHNKCE